MKTYHVTAKHWEQGWELHVKDVGVTQSRTLADAERMVCDLLVTWFGSEPDDFDIALMVDLEGLEDQVAETRAKTAEATRLQREAAEDARKVARELRSLGLSVSDTATVMGVSRGRVSQLVS